MTHLFPNTQRCLIERVRTQQAGRGNGPVRWEIWWTVSRTRFSTGEAWWHQVSASDRCAGKSHTFQSLCPRHHFRDEHLKGSVSRLTFQLGFVIPSECWLNGLAVTFMDVGSMSLDTVVILSSTLNTEIKLCDLKFLTSWQLASCSYNQDLLIK